jgi:ankyrin repeat protein
MGEQFKWNPSNERVGQMLRQAVYMEDQVTLEHLVKQKADLESKDETGATPLHIAAAQSRPQTIAWLVSHRADVSALDSEGFNALTWACVKGHHAAVAQLLTCRANPDLECSSNGKTPLSLAAERGHKECISELLDQRASLLRANRDSTSALMCAAHHNETDIVAYLLGRNCAVNKTDDEGWTALHYIVNAPVPPTTLGGEASEKKVLLDGSVGKKFATELLLLHKADCNAQSNDGLTPLLICSGKDRPVAVRRLLESKAEVNLCSARGQSPLLMAAAHDLPDVVRALILAQAEVNHQNLKGKSPLSIAEEMGNKEVVELLKRAGAVAKAKGKKKKKG